MTERIINTQGQGGQRINSNRSGRPSQAEREQLYTEFREYYSMGFSDLRIAEETGVCDRTVRRWRYRETLPNIYGRYPTYGG